MSKRLEKLRREIDQLIEEKQSYHRAYYYVHLYSVSYFCVLLAKQRGLDADLAAASGMLHDIYQIDPGELEKHARKGAVKAEGILRQLGTYSDEEIEIIVHAVKYHSAKRKFHGPYDE
ncbi:MAG: HD domain-containing protein, partial [Coriobacteriia bacterium]|nr:HD domain-containing protein [Coriobacteriia bacterium]